MLPGEGGLSRNEIGYEEPSRRVNRGVGLVETHKPGKLNCELKHQFGFHFTHDAGHYKVSEKLDF